MQQKLSSLEKRFDSTSSQFSDQAQVKKAAEAAREKQAAEAAQEKQSAVSPPGMCTPIKQAAEAPKFREIKTEAAQAKQAAEAAHVKQAASPGGSPSETKAINFMPLKFVFQETLKRRSLLDLPLRSAATPFINKVLHPKTIFQKKRKEPPKSMAPKGNKTL